ncbi:unnamed protein product [Cyclocybe aegerita]|uniref:Uncharacterized protein n=1 Tax=Cyclocybe aegerita TaxID=1973307 RepID=A0A8S0W980_CYCAE|nr:unnamed protein product [Cyclocybe aegerita]
MSSSSSSTVSLLPSSSYPSSSKNWESSFGTLASSFGFVGGVPSLPQKKSSSTKSSKVSKSPNATAHAQPKVSSLPSPKNYEAAFASLSSAYGSGGGVLSVAQKK